VTTDDELIAMHRAVAAYHEELARQMKTCEVRAYHSEISKVLRAEAALIADRRARGSPAHIVASEGI
jgi:hypothetical protein